MASSLANLASGGPRSGIWMRAMTPHELPEQPSAEGHDGRRRRPPRPRSTRPRSDSAAIDDLEAQEHLEAEHRPVAAAPHADRGDDQQQLDDDEPGEGRAVARRRPRRPPPRRGSPGRGAARPRRRPSAAPGARPGASGVSVRADRLVALAPAGVAPAHGVVRGVRRRRGRGRRSRLARPPAHGRPFRRASSPARRSARATTLDREGRPGPPARRAARGPRARGRPPRRSRARPTMRRAPAATTSPTLRVVDAADGEPRDAARVAAAWRTSSRPTAGRPGFVGVAWTGPTPM